MKGQSSSQEGKGKGGRRNVTSQGRMKDEGCSQVKGRVEGSLAAYVHNVALQRQNSPQKADLISSARFNKGTHTLNIAIQNHKDQMGTNLKTKMADSISPHIGVVFGIYKFC